MKERFLAAEPGDPRQGSGLLLTPWTVEGRAALLVDSLDGAVAASCFTSFAFAAVHVKLVGEIAEIAVGMCEVIQARTTRRDGFLEDCSGSID